MTTWHSFIDCVLVVVVERKHLKHFEDLNRQLWETAHIKYYLWAFMAMQILAFCMTHQPIPAANWKCTCDWMCFFFFFPPSSTKPVSRCRWDYWWLAIDLYIRWFRLYHCVFDVYGLPLLIMASWLFRPQLELTHPRICLQSCADNS